MKFVCTLLVVDSIENALKLYRDILGLEIENDFGENISFKGGLSIHKKTHFEGLLNKQVINSQSNAYELYFEEDSIESIYNDIKPHYEIVHGIKTQPWQQRVFRFYDDDQHLIEIGETLESVVLRLRDEDLSDTDIVSQMGVTMEFVKNV